MRQIVAILVHFCAFAESSSCNAGTTSVQLIKERGYNLAGQTHVITGGDSGLGLGIATALMEANAKVVFLAHDVNKTQTVARNIASRTGNHDFRIVSVDLTSLNSTREAADALMDEKHINVFIGDAGGIMLPSFVTADGFESEVQLEYFAHFYLVQRLLPKLRESHGRVVFTGSDGISPYDKIAGLCSQLREAPGCEAIDRIAARIGRAVPPQIFAHFNGNEFLGLYLRVMLARQIALSETNITAFSFHPGWADTPGTSGVFDKKAEEWFGMFFLGNAGLVLSVLGFLSGLVPLKRVPLGIALGALLGYLFAGKWVAAQYCGMVPYYQCLCRGPDGTSAETCPISSLQGSVGGAYLAAAHVSEIVNVNGAMTVLCGDHPADLTFDPYVGMVDKIGELAARSYLKALYKKSQQWINKAGYGGVQSHFAETVSGVDGVGSRVQILM